MAMEISFLMSSKMKIYDNLTWEINGKPFSSLLSFPLLCIPLHGYWTKIQFSIKDFFSKCDQIRSFLRILKTSLMENIIFFALHFVRMLQFPETYIFYILFTSSERLETFWLVLVQYHISIFPFRENRNVRSD